MTAKVCILPTPPSLNNAFINVKRGGRIKSPRYRAWCADAHRTIVAQYPNPRLVAPPYCVTISLPVSMRGDIDNRIKPILDVLVAAGVMGDDRDVVEVSARKSVVGAATCVVMVETAGAG